MEQTINGFVHLHVHTEYSLSKAACRLEELLKQVKSWGMTSLAITDIGTINGAIRFCELAEKYGIQPVIGCEMQVGETEERLILLAATNRGYEQIIEWLNTEPYFPPTSHGDVIALSGGRSGMIHRLLAGGETELAETKALEYVKWFGKGNFYLEVQHHGADDAAVIEQTERLSRKTGIPLAATHDVHYLAPEDESLIDNLRNRRDRPQSDDGSFHLPSPLEMKEKFQHLPDALENTVNIAQRCRFNLESGKIRLPKFPVPENRDEESYLNHLCHQALRQRFHFDSLNATEQRQIKERMNRELAVINSRGLASYFLIVWDIVQYAHKRTIPIGPGRGSAAGSLVVYLLGITEVNPVVYELFFERFLSQDRFDLPDIDLDVCPIRRPEILLYIKERYGADRVAHIGVLNTFGTRGAVREAGKYLKLPNEHVNLLAKLLPSFSGKGGIRYCLETLPELQKLPVHKEPYKSLFHFAERMEGMPRNHSAHPSGILIGDQNLANIIPLQQRPNGERMTTFNKEDIKVLGLLKIDLLGLRNLSVINDTFQAIRASNGREMSVKDIPLHDPDTFRSVENGNTLGCFQLESMGIRGLMRRMKPKNLEDLSALLALYRPGAWEEGIVGAYLRRRSGEEKCDFVLAELEPYLASTYGLILYQEQVMQIAHAAAGYSMGEADFLRRALAKKRIDVLHRERFIRGAIERGRSEKDAAAVFDFLAKFAGYSFNKAHSVSYAHLSYWTVYLKTHYPKEYMASLLSTEGGYYDKRVYLRETVKIGIPLLGPDVGRSGFGFRAEREGIRLGMDAIKGCGPEAVDSLLNSRQDDGHFTSFQNLVSRMKAYRVKGPILKAWVASGACDCLADNRRQMIASLHGGQDGLFAEESPGTIEDFTHNEQRKMEKTLLGYSLDQTPSPKWRQFLHQYRIVPIEALCNLRQNNRVRICGTIVHSRRQPTVNGDYVLFLVLQDHSEMVEVILYPDAYKTCLYELNPQGIIVEGIVRMEDMTLQIVAEKIKALGG